MTLFFPLQGDFELFSLFLRIISLFVYGEYSVTLTLTLECEQILALCWSPCCRLMNRVGEVVYKPRSWNGKTSDLTGARSNQAIEGFACRKLKAKPGHSDSRRIERFRRKGTLGLWIRSYVARCLPLSTIPGTSWWYSLLYSNPPVDRRDLTSSMTQSCNAIQSITRNSQPSPVLTQEGGGKRGLPK